MEGEEREVVEGEERSKMDGSRERLEVVSANELEMRLDSTRRNAFEPASEEINGLLSILLFLLLS